MVPGQSAGDAYGHRRPPVARAAAFKGEANEPRPGKGTIMRSLAIHRRRRLGAKTRKTTIRVAATGIAALGLVAGGVNAAFAAATPSASAASAAIESSWSSVPEFSSAPALARGQLVNSGGAPVSRATVILFPVPVKPRAGDKLTPLARTTTDASGSFTVRLPAGRDALLTSRRSAGARNLLVMAFSPGGVAEWYYSLPVAGKSGRAGNAITAARTGTASIPSAKLVVLPVSAKALAAHRPAWAATSAGQSPDSVRPAGCGITEVQAITPVPVVVGMRESAASDIRTSFTYTSSASLTLGAAVSSSGEIGTFSANGTTTQTSGGSYTFGNLTGSGNNHLEGDGVYIEWENYCNIGGNNVATWSLQQGGVAGEYGTPGTPSIPAGDCITSLPNSVNTFSEGTQQTYSAGVGLSVKGWGINLSSQDGFTKNAFITYTMTTHGHPICGQSGFPGINGYIGVIGVHSTNIS